MKYLHLIILFFVPFLSDAKDKNSDQQLYKSNELVFKLKETFRQEAENGSLPPALQNAFSKLQFTGIKKMFPRSLKPLAEKNTEGKMLVDLSLIYKVTLTSDVNVDQAAALFISSGAVEYAEPLYIHELLYTPNDTDISLQYYLTKIQAFAGWDISKGDTNTVIGIVDTGTDWDHPDLQANIKLNYADPINGIDDDSDGFTDNFRGWDVSDNDNDPMTGVQWHGAHVSGCASAVTDNTTGVAGPGFKCRLLPVKSSHNSSTVSIDNGYDGIVYAADHGCSIINCSWGRRGGPSPFEQDVINYATYNHNALVVAAAGNNGADRDYYPASYANVLSVASTDNADLKSSFSNYSYTVDVCAPGSNIYSTVTNNSYTISGGTSMASPIAAGCAAIVRSYNPNFTPAQAAMRLRATSDNIYGIGSNATYNNKLGKGRINLFRALTDSLLPGIEVRKLDITDRNDNTFLPNDTLRISALFRNLLHPTSGLIITLTTASTNITLLNSTFTIGTLGTMDSIDNFAVPFEAKIKNGTPLNTEVSFVMNITDGSYSDFYAFKIVVNVDYLNITVNDISTTVNSKGRIGYNKPEQVEGLGFIYLGDSSLLYEGGLMIGTSTGKVSDCVRGAGTAYDDEFSIVSVIAQQQPGTGAFEGYGKFNDAASTSPINILVMQHAYAFDTDPNRKYVIMKYEIKNTGTATLNNLWAGIFADWDIPGYSHNKCSQDVARKMGYAWSTDSGGLFTGIKILSPTPFNHYAVDNDSNGLGGVDLTDAGGYTTAEKFITLSTSRPNAGVFGTGKDIIDIVSSGPFILNVNDTVSVAFALLAGDSLVSIQQSADDAQEIYDSLLNAIPEIVPSPKFSVVQVFPNPALNTVTLSFTLDGYENTEVAILDITGKKIKTLFTEKLRAGTYRYTGDVSGLSQGIYFIRLKSGPKQATVKLDVMKP